MEFVKFRIFAIFLIQYFEDENAKKSIFGIVKKWTVGYWSSIEMSHEKCW